MNQARHDSIRLSNAVRESAKLQTKGRHLLEHAERLVTASHLRHQQDEKLWGDVRDDYLASMKRTHRSLKR
jgi:hypothetical protein